METVYYFAYGSNMDANRMKERKVDFLERIFAQLLNYKLEFNKESSKEKEGYANIVVNSDNLVEGILYRILKSDLEKLDKCEGIPSHYTREVISIKSKTNENIQAFTYIANPDKTNKNLKPTPKYLNHLLEGKDILSKEYYTWLQSTETLD